MTEAINIVRIILRSDGSVHIAFKDIRSIYATANNILELFSDPIEFIEYKSHIYQESTFVINRKRVALDEVLGLTLASVNSDKQVICDFPELFQYILSPVTPAEDKNKPLNMKSFEYETVLSDEKSFLLRYYLEFTNTLNSTLTIKNNIKLRDKIQFEIVREIINTFFEEDLVNKPQPTDLSSKITATQNSLLLNSSDTNNMVTCAEYAKILGVTTNTVKNYIKQKRIKSVISRNGKYYIDKNEVPLEWDLRKGRKRKNPPPDGFYKRKSSGSAADVKEHILKLKLFTEKVAPYIHTFAELDYYAKKHYHEVCWDGRSALIIDINPDYIALKDGLSNRERILKGKAPVVPDRNKEEYEYHIHHIGQDITSPFAIVPKFDHNSTACSRFFHARKPKDDLHTPEFEVQKIAFWNNYLEQYDKYGSFNKIPYLNARSTKDKR